MDFTVLLSRLLGGPDNQPHTRLAPELQTTEQLRVDRDDYRG